MYAAQRYGGTSAHALVPNPRKLQTYGTELKQGVIDFRRLMADNYLITATTSMCCVAM